ncbi:MAG: HAMP domain-containing protein [Polyangiales bacterium]
MSQLSDSRPRMMLLAFGGLLVVICGALWLLARAIVSPIAAMRDAARRIAEGDLSHEITHRGSDEVGEMAEAFRATPVHPRRGRRRRRARPRRSPRTAVATSRDDVATS